MAYNIQLANRVRNYITQFPGLKIEEKKMFGGLAFMVNGKMCVNVSGENLMCRFNPDKANELSEKPGFLPMVMKGRYYEGYCYVEPHGTVKEKDLKFWIDRCLEFNSKAKSSKRVK